MKRFILTVAALVAVLSVPALAGTTVTVSGFSPMANGGYQIKSAAVAYGDLDLSTAQGTAMLLDRIQTASRAVCGERAIRPISGERKREFAACQSRSIAAAVEAVNAPALTQMAATH